MSEYSKIQTIFKRDEKNVIMIGDFTLEEFNILKDVKWDATEKVDGTNMRIEIEHAAKDVFEISIGGKTAAAQIPPKLQARMEEIVEHIKPKLEEVFPFKEEQGPIHITLYGEGYGKSIQKVGANYISSSVDFILFDVKIGKWWLEPSDVEDIANKLDIKCVPFVGSLTLKEACAMVANGFKSAVSEDKDLTAEGLVLRAPAGLCRRNGDRLITKVKTKDFAELAKKYSLTDSELFFKINAM